MVLGVLSLCVSGAFAQGPALPPKSSGMRMAGHPPLGPNSGFGGLILLMSPDVQKELGMTPEQAHKIEALLPSGRPMTRTSGPGNPEGSPPPRPSNFVDASIKKVLNAKQLARYQEIELQRSGLIALQRDEVAKRVGLTAPQRKKVAAIMDASRPPMPRPGTPGAGAPDFAKMMRDRQAQRDKANQAILTVLTPAQKATWKKMLGKPFSVKSMITRAPMARAGK